MKLIKQHPISLIEGVWKNLFLLAFPLLRGLLALRFDVYKWLYGAWFDLLVIFVILLYAFLRWKSKSFYLEDNTLKIKKGIFFRSRSQLPLSEIVTVYLSRNPIFKIVGATKVIIETNSGYARRGEFSFIISESNAIKLEKYIDKRKIGVTKRCYQPKLHFILLYSVQSTSALSGILLLSAFFSQLGAILGRQIQGEILGTINNFSRQLVLGIPPALVAISIILIVGFIIGFIFNLIRYIRFSVKRNGHSIIVEKGIFTRQRYYVNPNKIIAVEKHQSLLTKALGISSVFISASGYGKSKGESSVIFPAVNNIGFDKTLEMILTGFRFDKLNYKLPKSSIISYMVMPFWILVLLLGVFIFSGEIIRFAVIIAFIPTLWLMVVRIIATFLSGVAVDGENITISYVKGFSFRKISCKKNAIIKAQIIQNPFNKISKKCSFIIYCAGEKAHKHYILGMKYKDAKEIIKKII